jgi:hypothetical protein
MRGSWRNSIVCGEERVSYGLHATLLTGYMVVDELAAAVTGVDAPVPIARGLLVTAAMGVPKTRGHLRVRAVAANTMMTGKFTQAANDAFDLLFFHPTTWKRDARCAASRCAR